MPMRRCDANEHHYDDSKHDKCPHCRPTQFAPPISHDVTTSPVEPPRQTPSAVKTSIFGDSKAVLPVMGWLVVIDSPDTADGKDNKGRDLRLTAGMNRVGRGPDMEIILNFGDPKIGRNNHCTVTFDPVSNDFYLQPGDGGTNLTYLYQRPMDENEQGTWQVVLTPTKMKYHDTIKIGDTVLMFVPFCDDDFQWTGIAG